MSARKGVVCEEGAQATVELAVVAPVLVVLALISYNMMVFVSATARFDRVAPDIVLAHGSSPPASDSDAGQGRGVWPMPWQGSWSVRWKAMRWRSRWRFPREAGVGSMAQGYSGLWAR